MSGYSKELGFATDWNKGRRSLKLHHGVSAAEAKSCLSLLFGSGVTEGFHRKKISSSELCSGEMLT